MNIDSFITYKWEYIYSTHYFFKYNLKSDFVKDRDYFYTDSKLKKEEEEE